MKSLKIDFTCHALSGGGAERVMVLLAEEFSIKRHDVTIITFNHGNAYNLSESLTHKELHGGNFKNHTLRCFWNLFTYYRKRKNRPDVVVSLMPKINFITILVCRILGIKVIGCEHNNHLSDRRKLTRFIQTRIYPLANAITVLTKFDVDFFQESGSNVVVMPNPLTFHPVNHQPKNKAKAILVVGSLNKIEQKGWDNLIPIVGPVLKNNPEWKLLIAGSGEEGEKLLEKDIKHYGISNQVEFLGFKKNIGEIMKETEIFLMISRFEGLPMVLIEAMSQGMTCISYNCITGPSEIIVNNKNGILIEDQNMDAMKKQLEFLITNEELRLKLSKEAPLHLQKFEMTEIYAKWNSIFEEIL